MALRLFKSLFWLAAWAVWLWLGFGLYRELPRELGPRVRKLWVEGKYQPLGFVGDTNLVAVLSPPTLAFPHSNVLYSNVLVFDSETGTVVGDHPLRQPGDDFLSYLPPESPGTTLQFGVLLGGTVEATGKMEKGILTRVSTHQGLNVLTGEWKRLSSLPVGTPSFHATKPWISIVFHSTPQAVKIIDYRTGRTIFTHQLPKDCRMFNRPFFLVDRDTLVIPLVVPPNRDGKFWGRVFECWRIGDPPVLEFTVKDVEESIAPMAASSSGRVYVGTTMQRVDGEHMVFDVYDFTERRFLTTVPPAEQPKANDGKYTYHQSVEFSAAIAASGRAVLRFGPESTDLDSSGDKIWPVTLYEVGSGGVLWKARAYETAFNSTHGNGYFVKEQWDKVWADWFPNLTYETRAFRGLEDGSLLYRTSGSLLIDPKLFNKFKTLTVLPDGAVHRLPLAVNWPLLVLCQSILATPLVLLWAVLRWRRRRIARRLAIQAAAS